MILSVGINITKEKPSAIWGMQSAARWVTVRFHILSEEIWVSNVYLLHMLNNATPSWPSPSVSLLPSSSSQLHHRDSNHIFKDIHTTLNLTLTCWIIAVDDWRRLDTFIKHLHCCVDIKKRHIVLEIRWFVQCLQTLQPIVKKAEDQLKSKHTLAIMEKLVPKYWKMYKRIILWVDGHH